MARRSDHCLPSDSDKFTIKLHSLPSKFLSVVSPLADLFRPPLLPGFLIVVLLSYARVLYVCRWYGTAYTGVTLREDS